MHPSTLRTKLRIIGAMSLLVGVLLAPTPAQGNFAGRDGRVVLGLVQTHGTQFRIPLFTMNPDGTDVRQLTRPPWGGVDAWPKWSADGTTIAFERDTQGPNGTQPSDIFTVRANGTGLTQLTRCSDDPTGECGNNEPAWTPDGRSIVFSHCCVPGNGGLLVGLYVIGADGSHPEQLTLNPDINYGDFGPIVSPDGKWVAFSRIVSVQDDPSKSLSALFLVRIEGNGLHQVTSYDLQVDEKDWSPDGSRIVFVSHEGSNDGPFRADLFSVAPNGSQLTQLTHTTPGQTFAFAPSWSPSGQRIMFLLFPSTGCTDVYTMRPDGSDTQQVTQTAACEEWPAWGTG
jgi:Tol biopolymer transport system component